MSITKKFMYLCDARVYQKELKKKGLKVRLHHYSGKWFPYVVRPIEKCPSIREVLSK